MRRKEDFRNNYGPWALIAGASAGLGAAYADRLAGRGMNIILIARREKELSILSESLSKKVFRFCQDSDHRSRFTGFFNGA